MGEGAGAAIIETLADGTTSVWGTITQWEPPHRVAFTRHPGTAEAEATRVEVTFTQGGPGSTVVRLVHSGWERRPDGASARESYDSGWEPVIGRFAETAQRPRQGVAEPGMAVRRQHDHPGNIGVAANSPFSAGPKPAPARMPWRLAPA